MGAAVLCSTACAGPQRSAMTGPQGALGVADGNTGASSLHGHLGRLEIGSRGDPVG